eukprot:m51a1_g4363 hypothetical protein (578) ;mRNA; r:283731-286964
MRSLCLIAALVAIAASCVHPSMPPRLKAVGVLRKELPVLQSTIQRATLQANAIFTGITRAVADAARLIENQLELGLLSTSLHLTDLTFVDNRYPILEDTNPARVSEFIVSNEALRTAPEPLNQSVGGAGTCACRAERDRLCEKYNATPGVLPCLRCDRACEVLLMYRLTSSLDSWVSNASRYHPLASAWYWERGDGNLSQDLSRLYVVLPGGKFAFGPRIIADGSVSWGTRMSLLVYHRPLFDRTPAWSKPYIDYMTRMSCMTVGVPAWSSSGESLGGFEADMLMADSRELFLRLSLQSPIPLHLLMTVPAGDVIAAADSASSELFGSCLGVVCNVFALSEQLISAEWNSSSSYVEVEIRGRQYLVFRTTLEQGWFLWFFVLKSDASPAGPLLHNVSWVPGVVGSHAIELMPTWYKSSFQDRQGATCPPAQAIRVGTYRTVYAYPTFRALAGEWMHVATTYCGVTGNAWLTVYLNGLFAGELLARVDPGVDARLAVGLHDKADLCYKGLVDDLRLCKRELSANRDAVISENPAGVKRERGKVRSYALNVSQEWIISTSDGTLLANDILAATTTVGPL